MVYRNFHKKKNSVKWNGATGIPPRALDEARKEKTTTRKETSTGTKGTARPRKEPKTKHNPQKTSPLLRKQKNDCQ